METTLYTIEAKTASEFRVGKTDATVSIKLIGEKGHRSTGWLVLDNFWRNDFEFGRTDTFNVKAVDIGLPSVIRLKLDKVADPYGWHCEMVTVSQGRVKRTFYVYDWVHDVMDVGYGRARLPQHELDDHVIAIRQTEVERNRAEFRWNIRPTSDDAGWRLPRFADADEYEELPRQFRISDEQINNFFGQRQIALLNSLMEYASGMLQKRKLNDFDDYKDCFFHPSLPNDIPPFCDKWSTDEELARQILNGVNPTCLEKCTELPTGFLPTQFECGDEIHDQIQKGRVFIVNYAKFTTEGRRNRTKKGDRLYAGDPIMILLVGNDSKLRPVAIQLEEDGHVFTPRDSYYDWLLAKLYFRCCDVNVHEWKYHFLRTHASMEPFAVAVFRSFSRRHPLYKLLRPHVHTVPAINTIARKNLLGPTAATNFFLSLNGLDMARKAFQDLRFKNLHILSVFDQQGTDDKEVLSEYFYRDDALLLWKAVQNYVTSVISIFYSEDQDVADDWELDNFVRMVATEGFGYDGCDRGFPLKLESIDKLVDYMTLIVFNCSVQHAASNFGQFEIYKFIPNAPGGMRLPPHKKGEGSMQRIMDSLPDNVMASLQLGTAFLLSTYAPNEVYLGQFPMNLFDDARVDQAQAQFRRELKTISNLIHSRNKNLKFPYEYLLPEKIPISIAV
ncbi:polyunsaturated fatty acid 5-lipoxygenase [Ciona intestinalis]